jgi:hypothetical protein
MSTGEVDGVAAAGEAIGRARSYGPARSREFRSSDRVDALLAF